MALKDERAYYFPHDIRARADLKIRAIIGKHGIAAYGAWWVVVEILRESDSYTIPADDWIADALQAELPGLAISGKQFLNDLLSVGLLCKDENGNYYSPSLMRRMETLNDIREKRVAAGKKSAERRSKKSSEPEEEPVDQDEPENETQDFDKSKDRQFIEKERLRMVAEEVADFISERHPVQLGNRPAMIDAAYIALREPGVSIEMIKQGFEAFLREYVPFCKVEFLIKPDNWLKQRQFLTNWRDEGVRMRTRRAKETNQNGNNNGSTQSNLSAQFQ